jgi:peptidyl-prolyl cis-trans isomerase B (cyclophilin B)
LVYLTLLKTNTLGFYVRYSQKKILNRIVMIIVVSLFLVSFTSYSFAQTSEKLVVLETNLGSITIEFFSNDAPNHVENFIGLIESGFYDGTLFHRVIPGFMIQGGDPNTKTDNKGSWGMGGPGYNIKAEFNSRSHLRGIVSMARSQDPDSAGSQFYIVTSDSAFLDKQYTVFGEVIEGMDVADKIVNLKRDGNDCPLEKASMLHVTIE